MKQPVQRKPSIDALGGVLLLAFSILMGLNQVLIKLVNAGMHPIFQAGLRSALALAPVIVFALLTRRDLNFARSSVIPGLICGTFFSLEFVLLFQALEYTSVGRASVLFYTMPVWVAIGAHFLLPAEPMTSRKTLGLVLAVAGVALALLRHDEVASEQAITGDIMCLVGSILWAGIVLIVRATSLSRSSPEVQLIYQLSVSAALLLPLSFFMGETIRDLTPAIGLIFAFQVLVVVCVGFLTWFWVLSIYPASDMAAFGFLAPLFGVIFGWLILDEVVTPALAISLALVGAGIALVNLKRRSARS